MSETKIYLTYCSENKDVVQHFATDLGRVSIKFVHDTRDAAGNASVEQEMQADEAPIFLFVSDNFLKSGECMEGALKFIDNVSLRKRVFPIVIDGRQRNPATGLYEDVPTKFDKVSNVIRYMNYWQDEYLRLRREKREVEKDQEAAYQHRIDRIRRISNEVGEFLRSLRSFTYYSLEELSQNQYKLAFDRIVPLDEGERLYSAYCLLPNLPYVAKRTAEPTPAPTQTPAEAPTPEPEPAPTPAANTSMSLGKIEVVEKKYDVSSIPGLNLLKNVSGTEEAESTTPPTESPAESPAPDPAAEEESSIEEATAEPIESPAESPAPDSAAEEESSTEEATAEPIESPAESPAPDSAAEEESSIEEATAEPIESPAEAPAPTPIPEEEWDDDHAYDLVGNAMLADLTDEDLEPEPAEASASEEESPVEETAEPTAYNSNLIRTPEELRAQAQELVASGNYAAAKENYLLILHKSDEADVRMEYARLLQDHLEDWVAAKDQLEELLLSDEANTETFFRLGRIAEDNDDFLVAKNYYERVIALDEKYADAYHRLGLTTYQFSENQDFVAKSYFQEAINLDPENAVYHFDFAMLLTRNKNYKKARKQLIEAIDLDEQFAEAHYELALLYQQHLNRPAKALRYYEKAVQLAPSLATEEAQGVFGVAPADTEEAEPMAATTPKLAADAVKTVLVTGATSGIGKAIATAFAELGHRVLVTGRREERLAELCSALGESCDYMPRALAFDIREVDAVEKALNLLEEEWKDIDVLVNNAGLAKGLAPIHEGDLHHWETMIDTNIKGLLYITRVVSAGMVKRGKGHIINIGSSAGKEVYPNGNVYCATKFAVDALTKGMRLDLHQHGIKVTAVNPGHVETEFAEVRFDGDKERAKIYEDFQPLMAQDVADAVVFAATRPAHVNVQDVLLYAAQQASATMIDRSGRPSLDA